MAEGQDKRDKQDKPECLMSPDGGFSAFLFIKNNFVITNIQ